MKMKVFYTLSTISSGIDYYAEAIFLNAHYFSYIADFTHDMFHNL